MTRLTNSNNIQVMFGSIALMVIIVRYFATSAFQSLCSWNLANPNCIHNGSFCFKLVRKSKFAFFVISALDFWFCFISIFFRLLIRFATIYTMILMSIFSGFAFVKFRQLLNGIASTTSFCYNRITHLLLLIRSKCLESITGYAPVFDSFIILGDITKSRNLLLFSL